jgi:hypothetical protein
MNMPKITGGGANSRQVGHYKDRKTEPVSRSVSVGAVSRLGGMVSVDTPFKPFYNEQGYTTPIGPSDNMGAGPGANRMVMKSGSQGQHGSAVSGTARPGVNKPIFPGFK